MKKLMTIAAVALCTAAIADSNSGICSTAVVGYLGKTANAKGNTMIAPSFLGIDSATGCTLADLSVTGYEKPTPNEDDEYDGGCYGGEFAITFLTSSGTLEARYFWIDDGDSAPGWYANAGGKVIEGGASTVNFSAGQGVWVYGSGMILNVPAPEL